jgi:VanZ family protein
MRIPPQFKGRATALRERFGNHIVAGNALVLLLASWTPGDEMIRTEILSGHAEHVTAYALSGALMCAMLVGRYTTWWIAATLVAYAGIPELGQMFVPGRHAAFEDFLFSATGAFGGVIACAVLRRFIR